MQLKRGNVFIAALVFIALALSAAGGLYLLQTRPSQPPAASITQETVTSTKPSETANWLTYTNTRYRFSFKYPRYLTISPSSTDESISLIDEGKGQGRWMYLIRISSDTAASFEELINSTTKQLAAGWSSQHPDPNDQPIIKRSEIVIDNLTGEKFTFENFGDYGNSGVFLRNKDYLIKMQGDSRGNPNEFDQILATFEFLD